MLLSIVFPAVSETLKQPKRNKVEQSDRNRVEQHMQHGTGIADARLVCPECDCNYGVSEKRGGVVLCECGHLFVFLGGIKPIGKGIAYLLWAYPADPDKVRCLRQRPVSSWQDADLLACTS